MAGTGLRSVSEEHGVRSVPLRSVTCNALLLDIVLQVDLEQRYQNDLPMTLELVYVFPVQDEAAVSGFEARATCAATFLKAPS